jgi:hypothetical protein
VPSLEQIVRPFVRTDVNPPRTPAASAAPVDSSQLVTVRIGLGGSAKSIASSTSYSINYYMAGRAREVPLAIAILPTLSFTPSPL